MISKMAPGSQYEYSVRISFREPVYFSSSPMPSIISITVENLVIEDSESVFY